MPLIFRRAPARWAAGSALAVVLGTSAPASGQEACTYHPEFKPLQARLAAMPPSAVVRNLNRHMAKRSPLAACELAEIDRLLGPAERALVRLQAGKQSLTPHAVLRCRSVDSATAQCSGPAADTTGQAEQLSAAPIAPLPANASEIVFKLPQARLVGVYRVPLADLLEGKAATRLDLANGAFTLMKDDTEWALMAVFETKGPWRYRKAVWYFR